MDVNILIGIVSLFVLIAFNAFFVFAEYSLAVSRRTRMRSSWTRAVSMALRRLLSTATWRLNSCRSTLESAAASFVSASCSA